MENRSKKNNKVKKTILNLVIYVLLFSVLIYSGINIYKWYKDKNNNNEIAEKIKDAEILDEKNPIVLKDYSGDVICFMSCASVSHLIDKVKEIIK